MPKSKTSHASSKDNDPKNESDYNSITARHEKIRTGLRTMREKAMQDIINIDEFYKQYYEVRNYMHTSNPEKARMLAKQDLTNELEDLEERYKFMSGGGSRKKKSIRRSKSRRRN